jgi:hypothetical protein
MINVIKLTYISKIFVYCYNMADVVSYGLPQHDHIKRCPL